MPNETGQLPNSTTIQEKPAVSSKLAKLFEDAPQLGRHTIALVLSLISIWIVHITLEILLGKDARFFDKIPIRYIIDVADLVVLIKFVWHIIRDFRK